LQTVNSHAFLLLMEHLGDVIRKLLRRRDLHANELAQRIGISKVAVCRIVTGKAKPRQVTFTRIYKELVTTPDEGQLLVRFFSDMGGELPEVPILSNSDNAVIEQERVERFMEVRTQSIAFRSAVAKELQRLNLTFRQDYYEGITSTDFLVEYAGKRIAIECKFNTACDFPKTITLARLIFTRLHCDKVLVVVPFVDEIVAETLSKCEPTINIIILQSIGAEIT